MQGFQDPLGDHGRTWLLNVLKHDGELIAAKAGGGVGIAQAGPQAAGWLYTVVGSSTPSTPWWSQRARRRG